MVACLLCRSNWTGFWFWWGLFFCYLICGAEVERKVADPLLALLCLMLEAALAGRGLVYKPKGRKKRLKIKQAHWKHRRPLSNFQ